MGETLVAMVTQCHDSSVMLTFSQWHRFLQGWTGNELRPLEKLPYYGSALRKQGIPCHISLLGGQCGFYMTYSMSIIKLSHFFQYYFWLFCFLSIVFVDDEARFEYLGMTGEVWWAKMASWNQRKSHQHTVINTTLTFNGETGSVCHLSG